MLMRLHHLHCRQVASLNAVTTERPALPLDSWFVVARSCAVVIDLGLSSPAFYADIGRGFVLESTLAGTPFWLVVYVIGNLCLFELECCDNGKLSCYVC